MERGIFRGALDENQRRIFEHVLAGRTGREIATALGMQPAMVERIVRKTCRQLGSDGRRHAAQIIASHYGQTSHPMPTARRPSPARVNHYGSDFAGIGAGTAQTEREHSERSLYVQDVGSQKPFEAQATDLFDEITGFSGVEKSIEAFPYPKRILLIILVVIGSTLALSALVPVMQGFDKLMTS
jgi:DNA-binding CsgD family transcriptional regulator